MRYRLLGLLEIVDDAGTASGVPGKEGALLANLILNANAPLSVERLAEDLWGERQPENGPKSIQIYVSRLRKRIGADRLATTRGGYALELAPDEYDGAEFERLADAGRHALEAGEPERALRLLQDALALWRGPPLADFRFESFAQPEIRRLEELRDQATADRNDARLALGEAAQVLPELDALVRQSPLRERIRGQLMRCLYLCGRQAEALEVFAEGREALLQELGIEPGRELRELQQAILNQDASLEPVIRREPAVRREPAPPPPETRAPSAREVRKTVTALFAGFALSSATGERLDPEALRRLATVVIGEIRTAAERHGGSVETVTSDSVTAVFGLPSVHEDDAQRAARAAHELRDALAEHAEELQRGDAARLEFRLGVSTGEVVAGGGAETGVRTSGEPLTIAAQLAAAGAIGIDDATQRLLREGARLVSPLVGRGRARRRLHDVFEQAVSDGSCQLVTVLGIAGVGKSRLVREFLADLGDAALVARGRCLPYGEGITYWPLAEAVGQAVGLTDDDPPDEARRKLTAALADDDPARAGAARVAALIGLDDPGASVEDAFAATRLLFESLSRRRPLVLVFDDVHWGEATFLDLIEDLATRTRDAPILLVCLARPELLDLRPGWAGGMLNATTTLLEPLSPPECLLLIENLVGASGLSEPARTRIADAAEGNPLFVEEMLSMLIDDEFLVRDGDRWTATGDLGDLRVPPTIQALLAARLDQLEEDERATIEAAAVTGKVFYEDAVATLVPEPVTGRVSDVLDVLMRKELIRLDGTSLGRRTFRFRHLLIRDAAYDAIPKEARSELHARFGAWLESAAAGRLAEYEEVVGYHLEQAHRYRSQTGARGGDLQELGRRAAERLGSAGRRAFARSDARAGVNLVSRAVALLPPDDPLRVALVPSVRVVQGGRVDMSWADRVLTEAVEAAATRGDRSLAAHALVHRAFLRLFTAADVTPEELLDVAARAVTVFTELEDELGLARARRLEAQAHYLARRAAACAEASEIALQHARRAQDSFEQQEIAEWLEIALLLGPTPAPVVVERLGCLVEIAAGHPVIEGGAYAALGTALAMLERFDAANDAVEKATAILAAQAQPSWLVSFWMGLISSWQSRLDAAEAVLRPAQDALRSIGETTHFTTQALALAEVLYLQGRHAEVEALLAETKDAIRPNDVHSHVLWRAIRAKTLGQRDHEAAERFAREAVDYAAETDFLLAQGEAHAALAEVLALAGDRDGASSAFAAALRVHEAKENAAAAALVRARLAELAVALPEADVTPA